MLGTHQSQSQLLTTCMIGKLLRDFCASSITQACLLQRLLRTSLRSPLDQFATLLRKTVTTASLGTTGFPQGSCLSPSNTYRSGGGRGASAATGGKPSVRCWSLEHRSVADVPCLTRAMPIQHWPSVRSSCLMYACLICSQDVMHQAGGGV